MGRVPKVLFRCEVAETFYAGWLARTFVTWSTIFMTNHRADRKLREEGLTRIQCQPSQGRSRRPSQLTSNLTLIANERRNFCRLTGRRYKDCLGSAEFLHTLYLPEPGTGGQPGGTSSANLTSGLALSETPHQPGVPPLQRRRSDGTISKWVASEEATQIRGHLGVLIPSAATRRWRVGASHAHQGRQG